MAEISYEDIDLFYYHSIDVDFARFSSILDHGIVSRKAAQDENIKYYYRNYTHASCKDDYISVCHFPVTILRYFKIENELYDFNTNKIAFILSGDINAEEKQAYKNRHKYTNERHVHYKINPEDIRGILLRECDIEKPIYDLVFNLKYTDKAFLENKVFSTINFFKDYFGSFGDTRQIYYLLGKLREAKICDIDDKDIINELCEEMRKNIRLILSIVLNIQNPTLLDVIKYINNGRYKIYIMNRFDIQELGNELKQTDERLEQFKEYTHLTKSQWRKNESIDKKIMKLYGKMSEYGCNVCMDYFSGPLTKEDNELCEKVKELKLQKYE